jgi:RHH-type proline utilization regulon transcriptional repressor/proline dehydrogenase/delta 1-pyrroline-5-carboxylate dehydrogenase
MMGEQFVTGQTIEEALANSRKLEARGFRYSYDMLGEAAMTAATPRAITPPTRQAIHAIGKAAAGAASTKAPASRSSCRRCIRATAARSATG